MKPTSATPFRWRELADHSTSQLIAGLALLAFIVIGGAFGFAWVVTDVAQFDDRPAEGRVANRESASIQSSPPTAQSAQILPGPNPISLQP